MAKINRKAFKKQVLSTMAMSAGIGVFIPALMGVTGEMASFAESASLPLTAAFGFASGIYSAMGGLTAMLWCGLGPVLSEKEKAPGNLAGGVASLAAGLGIAILSIAPFVPEKADEGEAPQATPKTEELIPAAENRESSAAASFNVMPLKTSFAAMDRAVMENEIENEKISASPALALG